MQRQASPYKYITIHAEVNMKSQSIHFQVLESYYFQTSIKNLEYLAHFKKYFSKKIIKQISKKTSVNKIFFFYAAHPLGKMQMYFSLCNSSLASQI